MRDNSKAGAVVTADSDALEIESTHIFTFCGPHFWHREPSEGRHEQLVRAGRYE